MSVNSSAFVVGEALIDMIPVKGAPQPIVGGGAANTAKALANLGVPTSFIGGISRDEFGVMIESELSGVDLSLSKKSDLPTAKAFVNLDSNGSATYEFSLQGTATFDFGRAWLPTLSPKVIHVGTLATVIEPGSGELLNWVSSHEAPIVFDPNIRPSVLPNRSSYMQIVENWSQVSSIVKLSQDDLDWLGIKDPREFFEYEVRGVIVTRGGEGISGYTANATFEVPAVAVKVIDTIGAGDTVGAVIVESIYHFGLEEFVEKRLLETLTRAAKAAAITCSRAGANPPLASELDS